MAFTYAAVELNAVELLASRPRFRGKRDSTHKPLTGRLRFGGPLAVPIDAKEVGNDPDLVTFIEREAATSRYVLVHSAISFSGDPEDPELATAEVRMRLGYGEGDVIAWSLLPESAATSFETKETFSIGPSLKFHGAEISATAVGREKIGQGEGPFLQATGASRLHTRPVR